MSTQLSFLSSVSAFAKPFTKSAAIASKDPLVVAKERFAAVADESIKLIKAANDKGFWFKKHGDGYVVTLKNGAAMLKDCSFAVGSAADAIKLLEKAKEAAAGGEFDELFKATARAPKKPKAEAAAPAVEPSAAPAPATPVAAPTAPSKSKRK